MAVFKCKQCGKKFNDKPSSRRKYCSHECYGKHLSDEGTKRRRKQCKQCGKPHENKTYCSRKCQQAASRTMVKVACGHCGKIIERKPSALKKSNDVFCSRKCSGLSQRQRVIVSCDNCGIKMERQPSHAKHERRYCSPECRRNDKRESPETTCHRCGNIFLSELRPSVRPKFCSEKCRIENQSEVFRGENHPNWKGGRNPKRGDRGPGWLRLRKRIIRRDGGRCKVCGSSSRILQVHHIVPYKITQDNSPSNLVTLCVSCHKRVEHGKIPCPKPSDPAPKENLIQRAFSFLRGD